MLAKSILIVLLSFPASIAILGSVLALTPVAEEKTLPSLLMFFPLWIVIMSVSYLLPRKQTIALALISTAAVGGSVIFLTKHYGVAGI
ncbi:MAG: hypothetical protein AAGG55_06875 [Pseudomonadota bacterium]